MSPGFDISAEVAAAVGSRAGVWQFIQEFAALWRSPLTDGDGYGAADINAAQERLGVRFPAAVREAYGLFGRRADLTSNQDRLFRPGELRLAGSGQVLVFRRENQGCVRWGVPLHLPGNPDPQWWWRAWRPVTGKAGRHIRFGSRWRAWRSCCRSRCSPVPGWMTAGNWMTPAFGAWNRTSPGWRSLPTHCGLGRR